MGHQAQMGTALLRNTGGMTRADWMEIQLCRSLELIYTVVLTSHYNNMLHRVRHPEFTVASELAPAKQVSLMKQCIALSDRFMNHDLILPVEQTESVRIKLRT